MPDFATPWQVGVVGFEPAVSGFRRLRSVAGTRARLSHTLISESAQRESNPHFRHGKAAGYRYIMGAKIRSKLSKSRGGLRLES